MCAAVVSVYKDDWKPVLPVASAIEMIHAYSLIHDDLPAMDDDDFRRGKPSCHKQFDEAIAILAGDALLTLAFEVLGSMSRLSSRSHVVKVIRCSALPPEPRRGMVGGQVLGSRSGKRAGTSGSQLEAIHRSKTGALIGASVWIGAFLAAANRVGAGEVRTYCDRIGLAFQVIDDILDATDGRNRDEGKATYPVLWSGKSPADSRELMKARPHLRRWRPRGLAAGVLRYLKRER